MLYETSAAAISVFLFFVAFVLFLSFYLGRKGQTAKGYYAAHGQIHWAVNGVAFAGDYLSAASFLGICGTIAFYGYDGFLYSIGYLAGWVVALFVIAEPIKRLGKFTFADALDSKFNSRGVKLAAAISTLVVSVFYLIPQMVGAGALVKPLLGLDHYVGVLIVGVTVTLIVVTAGMVSTTWVQFIKGTMLVAFCFLLTIMILNRGLTTIPPTGSDTLHPVTAGTDVLDRADQSLENDGPWKDKPYLRFAYAGGETETFRLVEGPDGAITPLRTQTLSVLPDGTRRVNGLPQTRDQDLKPVGTVHELPGGLTDTGPLGPFEFFHKLQDSKVVTWSKETLREDDGTSTTIYYPVIRQGSELLRPGASPTFQGVRNRLPEVNPDDPESSKAWSKAFWSRLDFLSLMLALFCGTASLPHILIRYYTVKDQASARKSTVVGIAAIGFFYILTLYLGLGAMTSGALDPTNSNMAAPLLAQSFSNLLFAIISAIAFTTVLGTVSGLIMAASGAVAHDIMENYLKREWDDHAKVKAGKMVAACVGAVAIVLGILFENFNVNFLVGWAFAIAASANLPAIIMLLFWAKTNKYGIASAVVVGMVSSLAWILLSDQTFVEVYRSSPPGIVPFSQPGLVTIPLGFITLVAVSLLTQHKTPPHAPAAADEA